MKARYLGLVPQAGIGPWAACCATRRPTIDPVRVRVACADVDSVRLSTAQMMDVLKVFGVAGADVGEGRDAPALVRLRLAQCAGQLLEQATGRLDEVFGLAAMTNQAGRGGPGDRN